MKNILSPTRTLKLEPSPIAGRFKGLINLSTTQPLNDDWDKSGVLEYWSVGVLGPKTQKDLIFVFQSLLLRDPNALPIGNNCNDSSIPILHYP